MATADDARSSRPVARAAVGTPDPPHTFAAEDETLVTVHEAAGRLDCAVPTLMRLLRKEPSLSRDVAARADGHVRLRWPVLVEWLRQNGDLDLRLP